MRLRMADTRLTGTVSADIPFRTGVIWRPCVACIRAPIGGSIEGGEACCLSSAQPFTSFLSFPSLAIITTTSQRQDVATRYHPAHPHRILRQQYPALCNPLTHLGLGRGVIPRDPRPSRGYLKSGWLPQNQRLLLQSAGGWISVCVGRYLLHR